MMNMKKMWIRLSVLAFCAAAVCLTAAAAVEAPAPTRVWGTVSPWDGNGILLKNDSTEDSLNEVVIHLGDAPVVDAATGLPLDPETIKEGDTLYVWVSPAMALSLPPQVSAIVAVGNIPADAAAPEYVEIAGEAVVPAPGGDGAARFPTRDGGTLEVTGETVYTPWLTRQIVGQADLIPGARALVWKDAEGKAEKVLVFAYSYRGFASCQEDGTVLFNNEALSVKGKPEGLMPVRAVAEAAGYDVRWDKELGVVVSREGETVLTAKPGTDTVMTALGEAGLETPCVLEQGVTYLPAADLCYWLNVYFVK